MRLRQDIAAPVAVICWGLIFAVTLLLSAFGFATGARAAGSDRDKTTETELRLISVQHPSAAVAKAPR